MGKKFVTDTEKKTWINCSIHKFKYLLNLLINHGRVMLQLVNESSNWNQIIFVYFLEVEQYISMLSSHGFDNFKSHEENVLHKKKPVELN